MRASLFLSAIGNDISSPFFDKSGNLHAVFHNSGDIISISSSTGQVETIHNTMGQPSGCSFDSDGVLYVADFAHGAVLAIQNEGNQDSIVSVYEDKPLKGPNSIVCSSGSIYFTDSGPMGETGLHSAIGSLFCISNSPSGQILKPLSLNNLAYPSGIVASSDGNFVYVAEMMMNRILRFFQRPEGVYHGSVFYQLSGGVGPSSLAIDKAGSIYIGQYDTKESSGDGRVYVVSKQGQLISTISVPGPEISGLAIRGSHLYITEKSSGSIYRADI